jgi:hypothetical protein
VNLTHTDEIRDAQKYKDKYNISFPILLDKKGEATEAYKVSGTPTTVFIDKHGLIEDSAVGFPVAKELEKKIKRYSKTERKINMRKKDWFAGLGILGACALCCLPLITAGASAIGLSSIFVDLKWVFVIAAVVIPVVLILIKKKSKDGCTTCGVDGKCGCK